MNIKELVGLRVRELRKSKELSQEELGFLSGLHRTYISDIECGNRNVSIENIAKICTALQIDPVELFDFSNLRTCTDNK